MSSPNMGLSAKDHVWGPRFPVPHAFVKPLMTQLHEP